MIKFNIHVAVVSLAMLLLASCGSIKQVAYIQDVPFDTPQQIVREDVKIGPDDLLSIMVNSRNIEMVVPFNMPLVSYQISEGGMVSGSQRMLGYIVDRNGEIDFPILGKLKVAGLSRNELGNMIKDRLASEGLVKDAVVTVQFQNFKVSVLGEVNRPGSISVASDRISIFDALGQAGDMTVYGRRDKVVVLREVDGRRVAYVNDLRSANLFDSPCYYLKQNDIVYVEPNSVKAGQRNINQNTSVSTWVSIASFLMSAAVLIFK